MIKLGKNKQNHTTARANIVKGNLKILGDMNGHNLSERTKSSSTGYSMHFVLYVLRPCPFLTLF